jgi:CRP-like cAMP-binding protein
MTSVRRTTTLFSQGQPADSVYLLEDGLVKLTRTNTVGGRIILAICGPGHMIGEETLGEEAATYYEEAEILSQATLIRVPREAMLRTLASNPEVSSGIVSLLVERNVTLAQKVELLCLHDVEYRILFYLAELSKLVKPTDDGEGYQLPITQLELADLIGATRETTSTTLNQLERRGLVKLSRRLLTVPSPVTLRTAATEKLPSENGNAGHVS